VSAKRRVSRQHKKENSEQRKCPRLNADFSEGEGCTQVKRPPQERKRKPRKKRRGHLSHKTQDPASRKSRPNTQTPKNGRNRSVAKRLSSQQAEGSDKRRKKVEEKTGHEDPERRLHHETGEKSTGGPTAEAEEEGQLRRGRKPALVNINTGEEHLQFGSSHGKKHHR